MMERTLWILTVFALALAGCGADPAEEAGAGPAAEAASADGEPAAAAQPTARQAVREAAIPGEFKPFVDPGGKVTQGRCHMDACSWMKWEALDVVNPGDSEIELQARVLGGVSDHSRKDRGLPDYPDSADGVAIDWDPEPSVVTYRCSKTRPSVQWGDEPSVLLSLNPDDFIAGAMESAVRGYFVACHSDFSTGPGEEAVIKYDYHVPMRQ